MLPGSFILENLNITIKTSTLDYNGERDLSAIINCVIFRLSALELLPRIWGRKRGPFLKGSFSLKIGLKESY
jgi:hypothetical protein